MGVASTTGALRPICGMRGSNRTESGGGVSPALPRTSTVSGLTPTLGGASFNRTRYGPAVASATIGARGCGHNSHNVPAPTAATMTMMPTHCRRFMIPLQLLDVGQCPGLVEQRGLRAVEPEQHLEPAVG